MATKGTNGARSRCERATADTRDAGRRGGFPRPHRPVPTRAAGALLSDPRSMEDAEDVLQETLLAGWRGLDRYEGRASLRAWLYRIATNRCLNACGTRRRPPIDLPFDPPEPTASGTRAGSSLTRTSCWRGSSMRRRAPTRATTPVRRRACVHRRAPRASATTAVRLSCFATCSASTPAKSGARQQRGLGEERAQRPRSDARPTPSTDRPRPLPASGLTGRARARPTLRGCFRGRRHRRRRRAAHRGRLAYDAALGGRVPRAVGDCVVPERARQLASRPAHAARADAGEHATRFATYSTDPHSPIAHATGLTVLTLEGDEIAAITQFLDTSILRFGFSRVRDEG